VQRHDATAMLAGASLDQGGPSAWVDLGCGAGTFTLALASLLAPGSTIHAIDHDAAALRKVPAAYGGVAIVTRVADITVQPNGLDGIDGVLMANSLHYVREQAAFVQRWSERLTAGGCFLIVEYDTEAANRWVPFPFSRARLPGFFQHGSGVTIQDLGRRPSIYQRAALYAALIRPDARRD
jgi:trans-aconitate methyltransferase